jgi:hypothetical protein
MNRTTKICMVGILLLGIMIPVAMSENNVIGNGGTTIANTTEGPVFQIQKGDVNSTMVPQQVYITPQSISFDFAQLNWLPAGVAGGKSVVFIGSPLEGKVKALSRFGAKELGELPPPSGGFVLPLIIQYIGPGRVSVLDAGGFPSPIPYVPASPRIYDYEYSFDLQSGFSAKLVRTINFDKVHIGFAEDFVVLNDGRYVLSDALNGSLWVVETNGTISPGIVPRTFSPEDAIPQLVFCPSMPLIKVGGIPFLFTDSALPGVSPLAVKGDYLYFYSPCAEGLYKVPIAVLSDNRQPYERAKDISLVSAKPRDVAVEQLMGLTFNRYVPSDNYLYAADSLQLTIIRINVKDGKREVIADNPDLLDFPSSMNFLPPVAGISPLLVVSNQQERMTLTNDAITKDILQLPFRVAEVVLHNSDQ